MSEKMKILIGYDGSDCADAALEDLGRAGLPSVASAVVISVAEVWLPPPSSYEIVEEALAESGPTEQAEAESPALEEARALALGACERLQKRFPGWEVRAEAANGSPAWGVITRADALQPDLIVVGSQGRNALGRFVLGSVSQKVVTEARSSVRVARGRAKADDSPVRIVLGVDGSPASALAVGAVGKRSWPGDTEVLVVAVDDIMSPTLIGRLMPPVTNWVGERNRREREWAHQLVEDAARELEAASLKASHVVKDGDPKRELVKAAEEWEADCIFVGSTGLGGRFKRFLLGSVSAAVAARAACTVEVVRA